MQGPSNPEPQSLSGILRNLKFTERVRCLVAYRIVGKGLIAKLLEALYSNIRASL